MCGDDHFGSAESVRPSRRRFLGGLLAAGAALQHPGLARAALRPRALVNRQGLTSRRMAMHLHGSFSESTGSWRDQFALAAVNRIDIMVPTDHDWRTLFLAYRDAYHFTGLSETAADGTWRLVPGATGALTSASNGRCDATTTCPRDPDGGSLYLHAASKDTTPATLTFDVDAGGAQHNYSGSIMGRTLGISVRPRHSTGAGWLGITVSISRHGSISSQPLQVCYRFRTDIRAKGYRVSGNIGTVDLPVMADAWQDVRFDLMTDIALLWPAIAFPRDNAIFRIGLSATGTGVVAAEGRFAYLNFALHRGYDAIGSRAALIRSYADMHPGMTVLPGNEYSRDQHVNGIGGAVFDYPYPASPQPHPRYSEDVARDLVSSIHAHGAIVSYNHMYGTVGRRLSDPEQEAKRRSLTADLLRTRAYGCDLLEVGYAMRGGVDLHHHEMAWDTLTRNGLYLTGTGVSDDHTGHTWRDQTNRFITLPWTSDLAEAQILRRLTAGRAAVGKLGDFSGSLDVSLDQAVWMGQVSVRTDAGPLNRHLVIDGQNLPRRSTVNVIEGPVDYAGPSSPDPGTSVVHQFPTSAFTAGVVRLPVRTGLSKFWRVNVVDATGTTVAFSNPVVQLREQPPTSTPVPANRLAAVDVVNG